MSALRLCLEAFEGYEKELWENITPLTDAGKAELASLEAVAEAARTGRGLDDALDKLDALKEAGKQK